MTMQWSEICNQFCGLSITKYLSSCFSPDESTDTSAPAPKKDCWFLYLTTSELICRLNIDEFCKTSSTSEFECLFNDHDKLPLGQHTLVVSKVYMEDDDDMGYWFDPTDPEGPSFRRCDEDSIFPEVLGRGTYINNKLYYLENKKDEHELSLAVFDPVNRSWKQLPPLPLLSHYDVWNDHPAFSIGHKLVLKTTSQLYMFNTREETWEDGPVVLEKSAFNAAKYILDYGFEASVDFNDGFLIAVPNFQMSLAVYRWDSDGVPRLYRELDELRRIFCPFLLPRGFYMGKCGGDNNGRMWLVYFGEGIMLNMFTRVAVFRVSISSIDSAGNPIISAELEAAEFFHLVRNYYPDRSTAFALCHQQNGDDEDNKKFCGPPICHA